MGQRRSIAVLATLVLLTTTGCLRANVALTVNDDDTVDGEMVVAVSKQVTALLGDEFSPDELTAEMGQLPTSAEVSAYDQDGYVGQRVTFAGVSAAEVNDETTTLAKVDGHWEFRTRTSADGDMLGVDEMAAFGGDDPPTVRYELTFPYRVIDTNGVVAGDNKVTWEIVLTDPEAPTELYAITDTEPASGAAGGFPAALVGLGIAALVGVGVAGLFLVRSRHAAPMPFPASDPAAAPATLGRAEPPTESP